MSIEKLNIGLLSERNSTQNKLEELKRAIKTEKNETKKITLQREVARLERLDNLKDGKEKLAPKQQEAVDKVLVDKKFNDVKNSDLLTLKKKGIDIANLVLVDASNPDKEIHSLDIKAGDRFIVNFWENKSLDKRTWAGDILPPNIRTVKINGVECEHRNTPRPGYYNDSKKPSYQDIHDGYAIEILSLGNATIEDNEATEKQWKKERVNDMIDYNDKNPFTDLEEDVGLFSEILKTTQEREEIKRKNVEYALWARIVPGSPECIALFKDACKWAWVDESWASDQSLHTILNKESNGEVGRLNYTLKNISISDFKSLALNNDKIPAKSSASWLWQLLLSNVDLYYPSWRNGIGNPFEEAVGMVKYIEDRYGSPDIALSVYGKLATYEHAQTGKTMEKWFREWY